MKRNNLVALLLLLVFVSAGCTFGGTLEITSRPTLPNFEPLAGTWAVTGLYYEGTLIELSDYPSIAGMYDAILLIINEDGSFTHIDYIFQEGQCQQLSSNEYMLNVSYRYKHEFTGGEIKEIPVDNTPLKRYQITVVGDGLINMSSIDPETGSASEDYMPMQLTRKTDP